MGNRGALSEVFVTVREFPVRARVPRAFRNFPANQGFEWFVDSFFTFAAIEFQWRPGSSCNGRYLRLFGMTGSPR